MKNIHKKIFFTLFVIFITSSMSGCIFHVNIETPTPTKDIDSALSSPNASSYPISTETKAPEPTRTPTYTTEPTPATEHEPTPEPTFSPSGNISNWKIVLLQTYYTKSISDNGFVIHESGDSAQFLVIQLKITNNGKEKDNLLSIFGYDIAKIKYGEYTYQSITTIHTDDLHLKHVNPLISTAGIIVFEVPEFFNDTIKLNLEFTIDNEYLSFEL